MYCRTKQILLMFVNNIYFWVEKNKHYQKFNS